MTYLANALALLIQFVFGCAVALFVFRLLAEAVRADFYNPICQFLYRATNLWVKKVEYRSSIH